MNDEIKLSKVILIGGSPAAEKSYIARKLADEFKLPWISTDTIREQMRWIVRKEDYPNAFHHFIENGPEKAVEYLTHHTAQEIVDHQNLESEEIWKGVRGLIEGDYAWGNFIVEGVAILPKLVANQGWKTKKDIRTLFLIDEDRDRVKDIIFTRGLWDEANKYPDNIKDLEVEWVFAFNDYIKTEAKKYDLPVVSVDRTSYIDEIKKLLKSGM